jgi:hypothetical protein
MQVRRTIENGVYVYHLAEACPRGDVGQVRLWRTTEATLARSPIGKKRLQFRSTDLKSCLREMEYPEFDGESEFRPPLLRRIPDLL